MLLKVMSSMAACVTAAFGGFAIYQVIKQKNNESKKPIETSKNFDFPKTKFLTPAQKASGKIASVIKHDWKDKKAKTPFTLYECEENKISGYANHNACTYINTKSIKKINIHTVNIENKKNDLFFYLLNIDSTSKLPIFYFDYQDNETYPDSPEDLDFKKLKPMTNEFKKLGKYILIFGNTNGEKYEKFCSKEMNLCQIFQNKNANDWKNITQDESGNIITSDRLMMQLNNIEKEFFYLWWKPLLPFHENFDPDNYDLTTKNFSEPNNKK